MDDLFQRPLGPISIILKISKKILVKAEIPQHSSKKNLRSFDENWRHTGLIRNQWVILTPPASFRVNVTNHRTDWILLFIYFLTRLSSIFSWLQGCTKGRGRWGSCPTRFWQIRRRRRAAAAPRQRPALLPAPPDFWPLVHPWVKCPLLRIPKPLSNQI